MTVSAEDIYDKEEYFSRVPDGVKEYLTDDAAESGKMTPDGISDAVKKVFLQSLESIKGRLPVFLLALMCPCISRCFSGEKYSAVRALPSVVLLVFSADILSDLYTEVLTKISALAEYGTALSGAMGSFLLFGGGGGSAAAVMTLVSAACALVTYILKFAFPAVCAAVMLSALSRLGSGVSCSGAAGLLARVYSTVCIASASLLSLVVSFQVKGAAAADSAVLRGAKIAAAYAIPVVGGVISESAENITSAFETLRAAFGTGACLVIVFSVLPVFVKLLLYKLVFSLASVFGEMTGAGECCAMLSDADAFLNVMLITVTVCSVLYLYSVVLFCGAEVGA